MCCCGQSPKRITYNFLTAACNASLQLSPRLSYGGREHHVLALVSQQWQGARPMAAWGYMGLHGGLWGPTLANKLKSVRTCLWLVVMNLAKLSEFPSILIEN